MKLSLLRVLAMGVTWLTLTGSGCNLFEPAQPEHPNAEAIIPDYSDPDRTLDMIAQAVRDKARTNGSSIYIGAFADSTSPTTPAYHHFFWHTDVEDTGITPPADWSDSHELNFYSKFINLRGDEYQFIWEPDDESGLDDLGVRTAKLYRRYRVVTETEEGIGTGTIALGFADLTLVKGADESWRITIWRDRVDQTADVGAEEVTLGRRRLNSQ